jgi:3-oxoacyl-[acyl-carrier-protein] synthase III
VAVLKAFGAYLPARIVPNQELACKLNRAPDWILDVSGIAERRYAAEHESVADMAVAAATQCLERAGMTAADIGMFIVSSGSSERRFPGPASAVASRLGATGAPALDVPVASAGSLFGMALAAELASVYGNILVVAAEKMSSIATREPMEQGVAILFGDGAGACVISRGEGPARIVDSILHSDGAFAEDLRLEFDAPLAMNGRSVIMQASRKIPGAIAELLERNGTPAAAVKIFLMHQANQNLIDRVAKALDVPAGVFYSNIRGYGNTSSASMLIAASEWWQAHCPSPGDLICFAAFGAGFHWGALLVKA